MKFASLFSGIGGFELGIQKASNVTGIATECVFASEIDKHARSIYKNNFGVEPHGDITQIEATSIPNISMLVGGFPCQAFSIMGKREGFRDTRGTLFFEIARICKEKRPTIVFCENVKGLLSHDRGRTFAKILLTMAELGYVAEWQLLNSNDFGVPQNRERVYIIFHLAERCRGQIFPIRETERIYPDPRTDQETIRQTASTLTARQYASWNGNFVITHSLYPRSSTTGKGGSGQLSRNDGISYCLDCGNNQAIEVSNDIRKLTHIECERLQGFPDNWTSGVSDSQRYKQLGNAVTVNVIQAIATKILKIYGDDTQ